MSRRLRQPTRISISNRPSQELSSRQQASPTVPTPSTRAHPIVLRTSAEFRHWSRTALERRRFIARIATAQTASCWAHQRVLWFLSPLNNRPPRKHGKPDAMKHRPIINRRPGAAQHSSRAPLMSLTAVLPAHQRVVSTHPLRRQLSATNQRAILGR